MGGGASGSSAGGGVGGSSVDVAEGSSLGIPDEDLVGSSDVSVGRDDCKSVVHVLLLFTTLRKPDTQASDCTRARLSRLRLGG